MTSTSDLFSARLVARVVVCLALGTAGAACGGNDSDPAPNGLEFPVSEVGPYAVGYRTLELSYAPIAGGPVRTIPVSIWYPVEAEVAEELGATIVRPQYLIVQSDLAIIDAPPARPAYEGGFPLLVHSHGHFGYATQSYYLAEGLAAHGFVVAIPSHEGDTITDNADPAYLASWYERPLDVTHTLDLLANLPETDPLAGQIVTSRVVLSGHSRGTNTVWALLGARFSVPQVQAWCDAGDYDLGGGCSAEQVARFGDDFRDPRIVAGMPMAGDGGPDWFGGYAAMDLVDVPVFMMSGSADIVGDAEVFASVTSVDLDWIEFAGGCHNLFGSGSCTGVDDAIAQPAIRTYALAYARLHVLGDTNPAVLGILDGITSVSDIVTFHTR